MPSSHSVEHLVKGQVFFAAMTAVLAIASALKVGKSLRVFKWKCPFGATVSGNTEYDSSNGIFYYEKIEWGPWSKCETVMYGDVMIFTVESIWLWFFLFNTIKYQDEPHITRRVSNLHFTQDRQFASQNRERCSLSEQVTEFQRLPNMILPIMVSKITLIVLCYVSWFTAEKGIHDFWQSLGKLPNTKMYDYYELFNGAWINMAASKLKETQPSWFFHSITIFRYTRLFILVGLKLQVLLAFRQAYILGKPSPYAKPTAHSSDCLHPLSDSPSRSDLENMAGSLPHAPPMPTTGSQCRRMFSNTDAGENNALLQELPNSPGEDTPGNENHPRNPQSNQTEMSEVEEESPAELAISTARLQISMEPPENTWVNSTMQPSYVKKQEYEGQSFFQTEVPIEEIQPSHVMFRKNWKTRLQALIMNNFHRKTMNIRSSEQMLDNCGKRDATDSVGVCHVQKGSGDSFGREAEQDDKNQK